MKTKEFMLFVILAVLIYGPFIFIAVAHYNKSDFLSLLGIVAVVTVVYGTVLYFLGQLILNKKRIKNG